MKTQQTPWLQHHKEHECKRYSTNPVTNQIDGTNEKASSIQAGVRSRARSLIVLRISPDPRVFLPEYHTRLMLVEANDDFNISVDLKSGNSPVDADGKGTEKTREPYH